MAVLRSNTRNGTSKKRATNPEALLQVLDQERWTEEVLAGGPFCRIGIWDSNVNTPEHLKHFAPDTVFADFPTHKDAGAFLSQLCEVCFHVKYDLGRPIHILYERTNDRGLRQFGELVANDPYDAACFLDILHWRD